MDSKYLLEKGFKEFGEFDRNNIERIKVELNFPGVYAFISVPAFGRLTGSTDILYIGQAGSRNKRPIYKRIVDYLNAYASAPQDKRIGEHLEKLKAKCKIMIYFKPVQQGECKVKESNLLCQFSHDHLELPPLNRAGAVDNDLLHGNFSK